MRLFKSAKQRVLDSVNLTDPGKRVAKRLMKNEGLVYERLFNYLGELEDRLDQISSALRKTQHTQTNLKLPEIK